MEAVVLVVVFHIEFIDSLQIELIEHRDSIVGATGLLSLHIFGKSLSGLVRDRGERIVAGVGAEKAERGEEIDFSPGILLEQAADAIVDAAALGMPLGLIVTVSCRIVRPGTTRAIIGEIIG